MMITNFGHKFFQSVIRASKNLQYKTKNIKLQYLWAEQQQLLCTAWTGLLPKFSRISPINISLIWGLRFEEIYERSFKRFSIRENFWQEKKPKIDKIHGAKRMFLEGSRSIQQPKHILMPINFNCSTKGKKLDFPSFALHDEHLKGKNSLAWWDSLCDDSIILLWWTLTNTEMNKHV